MKTWPHAEPVLKSSAAYSILLAVLMTNILCSFEAAAHKEFSPVFRRIEFHRITLADALQEIQKLSQQDDLAGQGLNIVLLSEGLNPIQTNARFSLVAEDVEYFDLFDAICHRLGLSYRVDPHALVFASANQIAQPHARSEASVKLARQIQLHLTLDGRDSITGADLESGARQ